MPKSQVIGVKQAQQARLRRTPPRRPRNNLDQNHEALHPPSPSCMHNYGASSDDDDSTGSSSTSSYAPSSIHQATWDASVVPNEALSIAHDEEHVTQPVYCIPDTTISTPPDTDRSHASSPSDAVHEALQSPWTTHLSSSWGVNNLEAPPSHDKNVSSWFTADNVYANGLYNVSFPDTEAILLPEGAYYQGFEKQGQVASHQVTQSTQSSPSSSPSYSSSTSSAFAGQELPKLATSSETPSSAFQSNSSELNAYIGFDVTSSLFASNTSLQGVFGYKEPGDDPFMPATCPQGITKTPHLDDRGYIYDIGIYSSSAAMDTESAPRQLNDPRPLSSSHSTWTNPIQPIQNQAKKRIIGKRKRGSNTPNLSLSRPSSPAQDPASMLTKNLQEADFVSDTNAASNTKLACHFYKMNPKQHASCAAKTFQNISAVNQHLRKDHIPKGRHTCDACFQSFPSDGALQSHAKSGYCRPTGGDLRRQAALPVPQTRHARERQVVHGLGTAVPGARATPVALHRPLPRHRPVRAVLGADPAGLDAGAGTTGATEVRGAAAGLGAALAIGTGGATGPQTHTDWFERDTNR
ncbi:hypothetical protein PG989_003987 [Apiospora arundinis]